MTVLFFPWQFWLLIGLCLAAVGVGAICAWKLDDAPVSDSSENEAQDFNLKKRLKDLRKWK